MRFPHGTSEMKRKGLKAMLRSICKASKEVFKDVPGYEGLYSISNAGRIYSYRRNRLMVPKQTKIGYLRVTLCDGNGGQRTVSIHRLVASVFIPNPNAKPTVNHINEIKNDNRVENLEWATHAEQNTHGTRIARAMAHTNWNERNKKINYKDVAAKHDYQRQEMCNRHLTEVRKDGALIGVFRSQKEASDFSGARVSDISQCISGIRKTSKGYTFKRIDMEEP